MEQVIVDGGLLNAFLLQFQHDRLDFILGEDEVAHGHRVHGRSSERHPRSQRETGMDGRPLDRDPQVFARHAEFEGAIGLQLPGPAQGIFDRLPPTITRRVGHLHLWHTSHTNARVVIAAMFFVTFATCIVFSSGTDFTVAGVPSPRSVQPLDEFHTAPQQFVVGNALLRPADQDAVQAYTLCAAKLVVG
jgi:hypothetical protein